MKTKLRNTAILGIALVLSFGQLLFFGGAGTPAQAADIGAQLTNVAITEITGPDPAPLASGATFGVKGKFTLPDTAQAGDEWTWNFPNQIAWLPAFVIKDVGTDIPVIDVVMMGNVAKFTVRPEISLMPPHNREFVFQSDGTLKDDNSLLGPQTLAFTTSSGQPIGSRDITVVPRPNTPPPAGHFKQMLFPNNDQCRTNVDNCVVARINLKAGNSGLVEISDSARANWRFSCDTLRLIRLNYASQPPTQQVVNGLIIDEMCSPDSLSLKVDTTVLSAFESYRVEISLDALVAPGPEGLVLYENSADVKANGVTYTVSRSVMSQYAGGHGRGASLFVRKTDAIGNNADTQAESVYLPSGETDLVYTVYNNGDQNLTNVRISDIVQVGGAQVNNLQCVFPGGAPLGTTWAGPFKPKEVITCTARVINVVDDHRNVLNVMVNEHATPFTNSYWARNKPGVSVGDYAWVDTNGNGVQQISESGLPGVKLRISRSDNLPVLDSSANPYPTLEKVTNASGAYLFDKLQVLPGNVRYVVTVVDVPPGYVPTLADVGGTIGVGNNSSTGSAQSAYLTVTGAQDLTLDFGFQRGLVSVGDYVWWDVNRNGVRDHGEPGVSGVTVNLRDASDALVKSTQTDASGKYVFTDLLAHTSYTLEFVKPAETAFTDQNQGANDAVDSDVDTVHGRVSFTSPASGHNSSVSPDNPTLFAGLWKYNLLLEKQLDSASIVHEGDEVVFTLKPRNEGPVDSLAGWSVTEVLPAGATLVSMSGTGYNCTLATATCVAQDVLPAGQYGEPITVRARVNAGALGTLHNVAYVSPNPADRLPEVRMLGTAPAAGADTNLTLTDNDAQALVSVVKRRLSQSLGGSGGLALTGGSVPFIGVGVVSFLLIAAAGVLFARKRA